MLFDFKEYENKKVHFIGIGGVSMSGLAAILLNSNIKVSGSDFKESENVKRLRDKGAEIFFGHHKENITDQDIVVYTAAIRDDNEELMRAKEMGIITFDRAEFLGHIIQNFTNSIAVTGTHGKTSTTSMLSAISMAAEADPTILVGGNLPLIGGNYRIGDSDLFITEACEYKGSFLHFPGKVSLILNIEADHLDYYRDLQHVLDTFRQYLTVMPKDGTVVANADDPNMDYVLSDAKVKTLTFGIEKGDLRAKEISFDKNGRASFKVFQNDEYLTEITLMVPGEFNIYNALGAIGASLSSGISLEAVKKGLEGYLGVDKRFQHLYTKNDIMVIDDYAHHPGEIRNAIDTVLKMEHRKIHVVFQSHTYTRTLALFDEFAACFDEVDSLTMLPIFAAREPDTGLVSAEDLGDAIRRRKTVDTVNFTGFEEAAEHLSTLVKPGDIVLSMGAGESVKVAEFLKPLI
ncbi:MAG TPA: UDP-N-acetylmuramate--L-alanine ligase [Bacteroidales bacterium]|nr:UDP-N-acetylmuramate--L-alanine ligase [Bacteroidales bacterium]